MRSPFTLPACAQCTLPAFPPHLMCSRCGGAEWTSVDAAAGTVAETTLLRRAIGRDPDAPPLALASIRTDVGPTVIARLEGELAAGDAVDIWLDGEAIVVTAQEAGGG